METSQENPSPGEADSVLKFGSPREIFIELRDRQDGEELVLRMFEVAGPLKDLFTAKFQQAFWMAVTRTGLSRATFLHPDVEERAQRTIKSFLIRACACDYEDMGDDAFAGYLYKLAELNLLFACLSLRSGELREPDCLSLDELLDEIGDVFPDVGIPNAVYRRAIQDAMQTIGQMEPTMKTVMLGYHRQVDVSITANAIGLTESSVYAKRRLGVKVIFDAWREDLVSSWVIG